MIFHDFRKVTEEQPKKVGILWSYFSSYASQICATIIISNELILGKHGSLKRIAVFLILHPGSFL